MYVYIYIYIYIYTYTYIHRLGPGACRAVASAQMRRQRLDEAGRWVDTANGHGQASERDKWGQHRWLQIPCFLTEGLFGHSR